MEKKSINWLTPDYFVDCDIDLIPKLLANFIINWTIILPERGARFNERDFQHLESLEGLTLKIVYLRYRDLDPRSMGLYYSVLVGFRSQPADLCYINHVATPFFTTIATALLNRKTTILTAHQGAVHAGFKFKYLYKMSYYMAYSYFKNNNLFSATQADIFRLKYPTNKVALIPLALKTFGLSLKEKESDFVTFFTFGTIRDSKNIDLLIEAACNLYESGYINFKVVIAGSCENWSRYEDKIRYPELFNLDIRSISNSEIADLFAQYHYLVLPYKIVTQSGPLKIAFNYNVPVIASDLQGFKDEILDGVNGYLFENGNRKSLEDVLKKSIDFHQDAYSNLCRSQLEYVQGNYSDDNIIGKYNEMFLNILKS